MNDRELLVLASQASGLDIVECTCSYPQWPFKYADGGDRRGHWNPLIDSGDALRLSIMLRIDVNFFDGLEVVRAEDCNGEYRACDEDYGDDIPAAVRRAIVRAAAMQASNNP